MSFLQYPILKLRCAAAAAFLYLAVTMFPSLAVPALLGPDSEITFHLVDIGIKQRWSKELRPGDLYLTGSKGHKAVFSDSSGLIAQILVPMPSDNELKSSSHEYIVAKIKMGLTARIESELANDVRDFEIQFVQNINASGYFSDERQKLVMEFGKAAYSAFGSVLDDLKRQTTNIAVDGTFASNGTTMFAKSVDSWASYAADFNRVSWIDGRAMELDARRSLDIMGALKVRIINSYGDVPSQPKDWWSKNSIANHDVVRSLLREYTDLTVLLVKPLDSDKTIFGTVIFRPGASHILSAISPQSRFEVEQHLPHDLVRKLGGLSGRDINPVFRFSDYHQFGSSVPVAGRSHGDFGRMIAGRNSIETLIPRALSATPDGLLQVDRSALVAFSNNLIALADRLGTAHDALTLMADGMKHAKSGLPDSFGHLMKLSALMSAVEKDLTQSTSSRITLLSSHTVEQLFRFGLEWLTDADTVKWMQQAGLVSETLARRLGYLTFGVDDMAAGVGRMVRSGRLDDIEGVTHLLDGANRTAWGAVGYLVSGGNRFVGEVFANVGGIAAETARDWTLPAFERAYAKLGGVDKTLMQSYIDAQSLIVSHGQRPKTFEEYFGWDKSIVNQLSKRQLQSVNARFGLQSLPQSQWPAAVRVLSRTKHEHYREFCRGGFCTRTDLTTGGVMIHIQEEEVFDHTFVNDFEDVAKDLLRRGDLYIKY